MAAFAFEAVNAKGKTQKGVLEGDNARQIRQQLREQKLIPVTVEQVKEQAKKSSTSFEFTFFKPRISASELSLLTRQLATGAARASKDLSRVFIRAEVACNLIDRGKAGTSGNADNIGVFLRHDGCAVRSTNVDIIARLELITGTRELTYVDNGETKWCVSQA